MGRNGGYGWRTEVAVVVDAESIEDAEVGWEPTLSGEYVMLTPLVTLSTSADDPPLPQLLRRLADRLELATSEERARLNRRLGIRRP